MSPGLFVCSQVNDLRIVNTNSFICTQLNGLVSFLNSISTSMEGSPRGVIIKATDWGIVVSGFENKSNWKKKSIYKGDKAFILIKQLNNQKNNIVNSVLWINIWTRIGLFLLTWFFDFLFKLLFKESFVKKLNFIRIILLDFLKQ